MSILRAILGMICGIAATGPMSAAMVWLHRRLPSSERYPLPPFEITTQAVGQVSDDASAATRSALTWLAHFGYGGAAGALYAQASRSLPGGPMASGTLFGLLVWSVSYLGLLPGLRVLRPATEHPLRRSLLMIVSHLVWGWFLAAIYQALFSDLWRESAAFRDSKRRHRDVEPKLQFTR